MPNKKNHLIILADTGVSFIIFKNEITVSLIHTTVNSVSVIRKVLKDSDKCYMKGTVSCVIR